MLELELELELELVLLVLESEELELVLLVLELHVLGGESDELLLEEELSLELEQALVKWKDS